jgi:hypothetical protein
MIPLKKINQVPDILFVTRSYTKNQEDARSALTMHFPDAKPNEKM